MNYKMNNRPSLIKKQNVCYFTDGQATEHKISHKMYEILKVLLDNGKHKQKLWCHQ